MYVVAVLVTASKYYYYYYYCRMIRVTIYTQLIRSRCRPLANAVKLSSVMAINYYGIIWRHYAANVSAAELMDRLRKKHFRIEL